MPRRRTRERRARDPPRRAERSRWKRLGRRSSRRSSRCGASTRRRTDSEGELTRALHALPRGLAPAVRPPGARPTEPAREARTEPVPRPAAAEKRERREGSRPGRITPTPDSPARTPRSPRLPRGSGRSTCMYRVDGALVAVGVVDVLPALPPRACSFYDPDLAPARARQTLRRCGRFGGPPTRAPRVRASSITTSGSTSTGARR